MQSRRQARRQALRLLYQLDVVFGFSREAVESALVRWQRYSDERPADEAVLYVADVVHGVAERVQELDALIAYYATDWSVDRMASIDRCVLRLALYEMRYRDDIPLNVSINEAVELAKRYGDSASGTFVNGVLAQFKRERDAHALRHQTAE
ncbi:MAG TPA: transcription antitermination factor NusB [Armatimonadota bacterium]|nr:transcription antitermination factor NusB [Armatimonadota bacterium]HQK93993.1 transcription antitermination factor NusB [Armatimonadota bacterium]